MSDNIDNILDGSATFPALALVTTAYIDAFMDRFIARLESTVRDLPSPDAESDDAYEQERDYQAAFQEGGESLLPGMTAFAHLMGYIPLPTALAIMERASGNPAFMAYFGYMRQHTNINDLQKRMAENEPVMPKPERAVHKPSRAARRRRAALQRKAGAR